MRDLYPLLFQPVLKDYVWGCLLYTSDAADERSSVDLGGRRIIKKKKTSISEGGRADDKEQIRNKRARNVRTKNISK